MTHRARWSISIPQSASASIDRYSYCPLPKPVKRVRRVVRFKTPRVISDGGRVVHGFSNEVNDCTVRAISHARCISYADAHALCREMFDRQDGRGTCGTAMMLREAAWARTVHTKHIDGTCSLDTFAAKHPRGHYIAITARHSVAVCDGIVYDSYRTSGLTRVVYACEVVA